MRSDVISMFKAAGEKLKENPHSYRLYFKGFVSADGIKPRFGFAVCDHKDSLLFKTNGLLYGHKMMTPMEAEIRALIRGLDEALRLRITHISIFCDPSPIFEYLSEISDPKEEKTALLMDHVKHIRNMFQSSNPSFMFENDVNLAYELEMEPIVFQIRRSLFPLFSRRLVKKETCGICFDNDIDPDLMFSVRNCGHRFCVNCVKQHIEVKLLDEKIPKCPQHYCKSQMCIDTCGKLLSNKLSLMWKERIKEDLTPFEERVYCPYQRCSYLMSKTELSVTSVESGLRICFKCGGFFCVHCKVPWHSRLSCNKYKKLHPNHQKDDAKLKFLANGKGWRQCGKCHHMVERSHGCNHMTCRCGNAFCYDCGDDWNGVHSHEVCSQATAHVLMISLAMFMVSGVLLLIIYKINHEL